MKNTGLILAVVLLGLLCSTSFAAQEGFHSLPTREGVQQPLWLIEPDNATHSVILFAGGHLDIDESGIGKEANFLIRTRYQFASQGMVVAVIDKPSDRKNLSRFRTTPEHAGDIKVVMEFLRKRHPGKPLWLVGTSRGTISAAGVAARIRDSAGPDGIVLTSSLTGKNRKRLDSLDDVDLSSITAPTYIVHHVNDECSITPYDKAETLMDALSSVKTKEFKGFSGGETTGDPCKVNSHHGFLGIEAKVVKSIVEWIRAHPAVIQ
jgi:hypothetical protein